MTRRVGKARSVFGGAVRLYMVDWHIKNGSYTRGPRGCLRIH